MQRTSSLVLHVSFGRGVNVDTNEHRGHLGHKPAPKKDRGHPLSAGASDHDVMNAFASDTSLAGM